MTFGGPIPDDATSNMEAFESPSVQKHVKGAMKRKRKKEEPKAPGIQVLIMAIGRESVVFEE